MRVLPRKTATLWQFFLLCAALAFSTSCHACEQLDGALSLGTRLLDTGLVEYAGNGKVLVRERGQLPGSEAKASIQCDNWILGLEGTSNVGVDEYAGQTSLGAPLTTVSRINDSTVGGSLYRQIIDTFLLGMDVSQHHTNREIVGIAGVVGYPEVYDRTFARVGLRWAIPSALGQWTLAGSVSIYGDQSMRLTLPGRDPIDLKFSEPQQWELGLSWRKNLNNNLFLAASYRYINTEVAQSQSGIVTSSGNPVGVAYQPRSTIVDQPVSLAIGVNF
jgi:hypothetical protein